MRVALFSTSLLVGALVIYLTWIRDLERLPAQRNVHWLALAAGFIAAEFFMVHLRFRRDAYTVSLWEIPLVVGLLFSSPAELLLAGLLGSGFAVMVQQRQVHVKLFYNLSQFALETCLAMAVFRAVLGAHASMSRTGWLAVFVATATVSLVSAMAVTVAVVLHGGTLTRQRLRKFVAFELPATAVNTSMALLATMVLERDPWTVWLLFMVAAVLWLGYRGYTSLSERYASLELLYRFTSKANRSAEEDSILPAIVTQARELLRAERAEVTLTSTPGAPAARTMMDADNQLWTEPVALGAASLETRALAQGRGLAVPKHEKEPGLRQLAADRGFKDAMVAPLRAAAGMVGTLLVANRLDEVSTFDAEDLKLFETMAAHASVYLENGQLISRLRQEAAEKQHQALHDALTGLPNRTFFQAAVDDALAEAAAGRGESAVLLMDLDRFKEINDTLGHHNGDLVLKEVAKRLVTLLEGRGMVARLGGDEFAIMLPKTHVTSAADTCHQVMLALEEPLVVNDLTLDVSASIGVAFSPAHGTDSVTLVQRADVAMYAAKENNSGFEFYSSELDRYSPRRLVLVGELRQAIDNEELSVYYQPKVDIHTGELKGVEALLRWAHPRHGFIPPDEVIPIAEHTGLIRPLTAHILRTALGQCAAWHRQGQPVDVAVNLSSRSLLDMALPAEVEHALSTAEVSPACLTLEITESMVMEDLARTGSVLGRLNALGVRLSIDDFGTGHSSLAYLTRLPVSEIKIDRSFVINMQGSEQDTVVVRSIVDLGRSLNLEVVAEGVEDPNTWHRLADLGCSVGQGYLLSRPLPAPGIEDWLRAWEDDKQALVRSRGSADDLAQRRRAFLQAVPEERR